MRNSEFSLRDVSGFIQHTCMFSLASLAYISKFRSEALVPHKKQNGILYKCLLLKCLTMHITQTLVYGFLSLISLAPDILTVFLACVQVRPKAGGM